MNLLRVMSLVLVMSSGVMVHAKRMSESEFHNHRTKALIQACMNGKLWEEERTVSYNCVCQGAERTSSTKRPVLCYVASGPLTGLIHESTAVEARTMLRRCEEIVANKEKVLDPELKAAAVKWVQFKDRTISCEKSIASNRYRLFQAIDNADESDIVKAAQKSLHYRHPLIHRLQRVRNKVMGKK